MMQHPYFKVFRRKEKIHDYSEYFKIQVLNGENQMLTPIKLDGVGPGDTRPSTD